METDPITVTTKIRNSFVRKLIETPRKAPLGMLPSSPGGRRTTALKSRRCRRLAWALVRFGVWSRYPRLNRKHILIVATTTVLQRAPFALAATRASGSYARSQHNQRTFYLAGRCNRADDIPSLKTAWQPAKSR